MNRRFFLLAGCAALAVTAAPTPALAQAAFPHDALKALWLKWGEIRPKLPWDMPPEDVEKIFHAVVRAGFGAFPVRFASGDLVVTLTGTRTDFQNLYLDWTTSEPLENTTWRWLEQERRYEVVRGLSTRHVHTLWHMTPV